MPDNERPWTLYDLNAGVCHGCGEVKIIDHDPLCSECYEGKSAKPFGSEVDADQCAHWLVGAKVGIPQMYDLRCAREPHADGKHVCGSTDWNDSAGDYRG